MKETNKQNITKERKWFNLSMVSSKMLLIGDEKANCFAQRF